MMKNETDINIKNTEKRIGSITNDKKTINMCGLASCFVALNLLVFLFVGTLSAQDNYTVIVSCPVTKVATLGYYSSESYRFNRAHHVESHSSSASYASASYITTAIKARFSTSSSRIQPGNDTWTSSVSTTRSIGFANFNIGVVPSCMNVDGATMLWKNANSSSHWFTVYGVSAFPTSANTNYLSTYLSVATLYGTINTNVSYVVSTPLASSAFKPYNSYTTSGYGTPHSMGMWNTGTYTDSFYTRKTLSSVSSSESVDAFSSTFFYSFYHDLTKARANNVTSMGMMFWMYTYASSAMQYYLDIPSNSLTLKVQYAAPWSCVLSLSVRPNTSSVCANDGVFTLSASQSYNTNYFSLSPTSWRWYSATASSGPYNEMGGTTASTYAVTAPSNTGSVWYRFSQSVRFVSNSTLTTLSNSYSISYCNPGSIYVSQCCMPLGSNPTFSGTQVSDRSVTLTWNGMGSNVDHFVIRYGTEGGVGFEEISVSGSATSTTINELTNGHTYYFQIQAISSSSDYCDTPLSTKVPLTPVCNE
jgi:hypothetical protein